VRIAARALRFFVDDGNPLSEEAGMRAPIWTTTAMVGLTALTTPARHTSVTSMEYLGSYSAGSAVKIWRGFTADIVVHGSLLDTSTGIEVRDASNNVANGVTAFVTSRTGGSNTQIIVRVTSTATAATGTYHVLIHYAVEFSGPDKFDLKVFEHGTVSSMRIEEAAEPSGLYVQGRSYTLNVSGTGMGVAALDVSAMASARKLTLLQVLAPLPVKTGTAVGARFLVRFDTIGVYTVPPKVLYDGRLGSPPTTTNATPAQYDGSSGAFTIGLVPSVASLTPSPLVPGSPARLTGSHLPPRGYTQNVSFLPRYRDVGSPARTALQATASSGDLTFSPPSSVRGDSATLIYQHSFSGADTLAATTVALPTVGVTLEPPVLQGMRTLGSSTAAVTGENKILVSGAQVLLGKFFVPLSVVTSAPTKGTFTTITSPTSVTSLVASLPTVRFGSTTLTVTAARYSPTGTVTPFLTGSQTTTQVGVDSLFVTMPVVSDNTTQTLTITTSAGTATIPNVLYVAPPLLNFFEELLPNGTFQNLTTNQLLRGHTYRLHGDNLEILSSTGTSLQRAAIALNGSTLSPHIFTQGGFGFDIVSSAQTGTLTLTTIGGSTSIPVTIADAPSVVAISGLVLSPSKTAGGNSLTATIAFNGTVPSGSSAGNVVLSMSPFDSAVVLPTAPIAIASNPLAVSIPTRAVRTSRTTTISAVVTNTSTPSSGNATVTVTPPNPTSLTLSSASVAGGQPVTATVHLDATIPQTAGVPIALASNDPTTATVPASVIASGNTATFTIQTPVVPSARQVTISATSNGVTTSTTLTVNPPTITTIAVSASNVVAETAASATLTLSAAPPTPITATVSCDDAAVTCPATVSISGTSATFAISSIAVPVARTVTLTATVNGVAKTTTFALQPLAIQSVTLSPTSVRGGVQSSMTIQLNAPVPSGSSLSVQVGSSNATLASGPAQTFAVGNSTKILTVTTTGTVAQNTPVTFTVSFTRTTTFGPATSSKTATLTITP
jgi:hypothetical protein